MFLPLSERPVGNARWFAPTRWSLVLAAGGHDSPQGTQAKERLCRTHWAPRYAYVGREGYEKLPPLMVGMLEVVSSQQSREEFLRQVLRFHCRTHATRAMIENDGRPPKQHHGGWTFQDAGAISGRGAIPPVRKSMTNDFVQKAWRDLYRNVACRNWRADRGSA